MTPTVTGSKVLNLGCQGLKEKASEFQGKTHLYFKNKLSSLIIKVPKQLTNSEGTGDY